MGSLPTNDAQIPVIDISSSNSQAPKQLLEAARRNGFVFVANNEAGVAPDLVSKTFSIAKEFFALPVDEKQKVAMASNKAGKNRGWISQGVEKLDPGGQQRPDVKEAFNMGAAPQNPGVFDQPLPQPISQNLSTITSFEQACDDLCTRIIAHFNTALALPSDWLTTRHDRTKGPVGTVLRLLYYPARQSSTANDVDIRAGAHSDYGSVTCLFQLPGQPGLEVETPSGNWAPVPVDPLGEGGALPILVNIGDLLEDWTGGLLKSTKHRVVFPQGEAADRYSIAYFCHPLDDALLEPVPSKVVEEHVKLHGATSRTNGRIITAKDHLMERLGATQSLKT